MAWVTNTSGIQLAWCE